MLGRWWLIVIVAALSLGSVLIPGAAYADNSGAETGHLVCVQFEMPRGPSPDGDARGTGVLCSDYKLEGEHWSDPGGIEYWINPTDSGVAAGSTITAVNAAFAAWDGACALLGFSYQGTSGLRAGVSDGVNVVSWEDLGSSDAIGLTSIWYNTVTMEIAECDTQMNTAFLWSYTAPNVSHDLSGSATADASRYSDPTNSGTAGRFDIQHIMTHEAGHWLFLGDLYGSGQSKLTMYGYGDTGDLWNDTLAYGDELGVEALYPTMDVSLVTTGLSSGRPATVRYELGGVAKTETTCGTWSGSVDKGSALSIDNTVAVSSTERYSTADTTSWIVTQAGSHSVAYFHQIKPAITAVAAGTGHADLSATNCATLTYYSFGSAESFDVFDGRDFSDWVDAGTTAGLSNVSSASQATHRWYTSGTTSWVINDAVSCSATYWEQFKVTINHAGLDASRAVAVSVVQLGATQNTSTTGVWSDWADVGSTLSTGNTVTVSAVERCFTSDRTQWSVAQAGTYPVNYNTEYYLEVRSELGNPRGTGWYVSGSRATISVSSPQGFLVRQVFARWSGDSSATSATAATSMDRPKSVTAEWRTDYTQLYILVFGILFVVGMVIAATVLALRFRGRRTSYGFPREN